MESLRESVLWLTMKRCSDQGRACRDYHVHNAAGNALLAARAFNWSRDIVVCDAANTNQAIMLLRRRRSFLFSGKVDVVELPAQRRLGIVSRGGRFRDAAGRPVGRFQDARSFGSRAKEGVFLAVLEAMLGGEGTDSQVSGPTGFVYIVSGRPAATLASRRLPFVSEPHAEPRGARRWLRGVLPARIGAALLDPRPPRGWKLERTTSSGADARLELAAALFAVELSHW